MSDQPSIRKNYLFHLLNQIFTVITPLITAPYLSRVLTADGIGVQSYTNSVQYYFLLFAVLGTAGYGTREISRNRDSKENYSGIFWEIELLTIGTSLICLAAWVAFLLFAGEHYRPYYIVLIPNLIGTMFDITWLYGGLERIYIISIRNILFKILNIVLIFWLVKNQGDLSLCILINSGITAVSAVSLWTGLPKLVGRPVICTENLPHRFRETIIYFMPTIAVAIYVVLDKIMIGLITDSESQNGYYEQADRIISALRSVSISSITGVLGTRSAYLMRQGKVDEVRRHNNINMNYSLFLGIGAMFGLWAVAEEFVPLFFGPGYEEVAVLLYILAPIASLIGISSSLDTNYYIPKGDIKKSTKYLLIGSAVNLVLNMLLIQAWGGRGAAVASVVSQLVATTFYMRNCHSFFTLRELTEILWKKTAAGLIMLLILKLAPLSGVPWEIVRLCIRVAAGAVVYILVLLLLRDEWTVFTWKAAAHTVGKRIQK